MGHCWRSSPWAIFFSAGAEPVICGRGLEFGRGRVVPEINFTLPRIDISDLTWPAIRAEIYGHDRGRLPRAVELEVPRATRGIRTLPPMTIRPQWGVEITRILAIRSRPIMPKYGLKNALRLTPTIRAIMNVPAICGAASIGMAMLELFHPQAAGAGAISWPSNRQAGKGSPVTRP